MTELIGCVEEFYESTGFRRESMQLDLAKFKDIVADFIKHKGGKEDIERFAKTLQLPERGKVYMKGIFEDEALPTEVTELVKDSLEKVSSEVEASDEVNA